MTTITIVGAGTGLGLAVARRLGHEGHSVAVRPGATVTGTSVAFAAESAYAQLLHDALGPDGIHVGQLIVPLGIGGGDPDHEPDALADALWRIHTEREGFRTFVAPLD